VGLARRSHTGNRARACSSAASGRQVRGSRVSAAHPSLRYSAGSIARACARPATRAHRRQRRALAPPRATPRTMGVAIARCPACPTLRAGQGQAGVFKRAAALHTGRHTRRLACLAPTTHRRMRSTRAVGSLASRQSLRRSRDVGGANLESRRLPNVVGEGEPELSSPGLSGPISPLVAPAPRPSAALQHAAETLGLRGRSEELWESRGAANSDLQPGRRTITASGCREQLFLADTGSKRHRLMDPQ
jgi:hypothetical protein